MGSFDVFLNHRGPDVKKTFVKHLYKALCQAGCEPFLDKESLEPGNHAFNFMDTALLGARVHVAVFSPGYAGSKHCLNELCMILKSKKPVIAVFYNVEPENLRWIENGPFAKAFQDHLEKGREDLETVQRWKAALSQAANITGLRLADCNDDAVLVERVVAAVLNHLPAINALPSAKHPVGLKEAAEKVINILLKMGNDVGVVGIKGQSGIGKTALAKEIYNQEQPNFKFRCFLKNVKGTGAVIDLQKRMVMDLLRVDVKEMLGDFAKWFEKIQKKKVLLVIDDISDRTQFDDLIPDLKVLVPGSRVIITSQNVDALESILGDAQQSHMHEVRKLCPQDSENLFIQCAFRKNSKADVDLVFREYVDSIVQACDGLPLALELMGGSLVEQNDLKVWKEAPVALRRNGNVSASLQRSYDALVDDVDKRMFLDIACFMDGRSKELAIQVWDSTGLYGSPLWSLNSLMNRCLVAVEADGRLSMHELLRNMGRNVVEQKRGCRPEMQTRIWDPSKAAEVLKNNPALDEVLAFSVAIPADQHTSTSSSKEQPFEARLFSKMVNLRYLFLDGCSVKGGFSKWPKELKWVQWRKFPHSKLPGSFKLQNLGVLDLANSDSLTRLRSGNFQNARPLLKGFNCLPYQNAEFPGQELRILILSRCIKLKVLPQCINKLSKLKNLDLEGCEALKLLPDSLGELKGLEQLNLKGCKSLKSLPDSLGNLTELEQLNLSNCSTLSCLPLSMVNLLNLRELLLEGCLRLKTLPEEFGNLESLKTLKASSNILEELPRSLGRLERLTEASFGQYTQASLENQYQNVREKKLHENFGFLRTLQKLTLSFEELYRLPDSFSNLSTLEELNLSGCRQLLKLCPSISGLKKLRVLRIIDSPKIIRLPKDFGQLQSLTEATFKSCDQLEDLSEDFGSLESLLELSFITCLGLTKFPDSFSKLSNLEALHLTECPGIEYLPGSIGGLKKLRVLRMKETGIKELPGDIGQLQSLTEADIEGCLSLTRLPDSFSELLNLHVLKLDNCTELQELPTSISGLRNLKTLSMISTKLRKLPEDFGQLQSLKSAHFSTCKRLEELCENFGDLSRLQYLSFSGCKNLLNLPISFSRLLNLKNLVLSSCKKLTMLPRQLLQLRELVTLELENMTWNEHFIPEDFCRLSCEPRIDYQGLGRLAILCPPGARCPDLHDYFASKEAEKGPGGNRRITRVKWSSICKPL